MVKNKKSNLGPYAALLLEKDPSRMPNKVLDAAIAHEVLGCQLYWWPYYNDWCCACQDAPHGMDQQCSVVASYSSYIRLVMQPAAMVGLRVRASDSTRQIAVRTLRRARQLKARRREERRARAAAKAAAKLGRAQ